MHIIIFFSFLGYKTKKQKNKKKQKKQTKKQKTNFWFWNKNWFFALLHGATWSLEVQD